VTVAADCATLLSMPPGKPFPKVTDAQRAAFGAAVKADVVPFLKNLGLGAVERGVQFARENPNNVVVATIAQTERDTGFITVLARAAQKLVREKEAEVNAEAERTAREAAEAQRRAAQGEVIDAEFVEEPKK
jgi:hypothetical protein